MTTQDLAEKNLIYKVVVGSWAYGTNLPTSDVDYGGIFVPPIEYYFGMKTFDLLNEQKEDDKNYYSLRKYAHLACANNPNVMELLFVDKSDILYEDPAIQRIKDNRHVFLSQRCMNTYCGYASAQLYRIKNHRKWLTQELKAMDVLMPAVYASKINSEWTQWRFGANLVKRINMELDKPSYIPPGLDLDQVRWVWNATGSIQESVWTQEWKDRLLNGLAGTGLLQPMDTEERFYHRRGDGSLVFDEYKYKEEKKYRGQYTTWMAERDPKRHQLELDYGYDTKHGGHLVRLLRTGYEILTTGQLQVKRPDAAELLAIRNGAWSYEQIIAYADEMLDKVKNIKNFAVPEQPDVKLIDQMVIEATTEVLGVHLPEVVR